MKKAYLHRYNDNGIQTIGILFFDTIDGVKILGTLELSWKNNEPNISCIPEGKYSVKTTYSPKYKKNMWQIMDVPNRNGIRIHSGNYYFDISGCILLGMSIRDINDDGQLDVSSSIKAIAYAKYYLGEEFELNII